MNAGSDGSSFSGSPRSSISGLSPLVFLVHGAAAAAALDVVLVVVAIQLKDWEKKKRKRKAWKEEGIYLAPCNCSS